ncbi:MAG: deoxynucleoside kinase [Herbinix sp.]|nr:deoxynucleoside kinase [Herbinix sp.]
MKGKVICIEGADGVGKSTLFEALKERYKKCRVIFKKYPTLPLNPNIEKYLKGEIPKPDREKLTEYQYRRNIASFYMVDRIADMMTPVEEGSRLCIPDYLDVGYNLITDRYTLSNCILQVSNMSINQKRAYIEEVMKTEFETFGIPKPDLVLICTASPERCVTNISNRGRTPDIHENRDSILKSLENSNILNNELATTSIKSLIYKTDDDFGMKSIQRIVREIEVIFEMYGVVMYKK